MLVLSRRQKEKIVFPNLGITVELLRSNGKVAQLGIDAPKEIKVLREEVFQQQGGKMSSPEAARQSVHELRNQINTLSLTLQVIQKRLARGDNEGIDATLGSVIDQLKSLDGGSHFEPLADTELAEARRLDPKAARSALLVDDSVNERTLLAELLQMSGFDVYVVPDGQQAIDFLRNCQSLPDFVLLDMRMPRMDGVETVAEIRSDPDLADAPFKLFAVSGADRNELQIKVGPGGVDRWFSKPVDAKTLVREMNSELQCA